jgi:hypothetical protein
MIARPVKIGGMRPRTVSLLVVALFALQGCTKTVYYAVIAPNQEMAEPNGCFQQCQRLHAAKTKEFVSCVETCPGSRVVKEHRCTEVTYPAEDYGCTTMHAQALDGVALGLGIAILVALNILFAVLYVSAQSNSSVK